MSVSSILYPKFRAEDSNGDPLIGGKLYTYVPGSTLPKTTYSDLAQTVANTNPVILDSRGEATLFGTGDYKFILKDENDVTVWSLDAGVYQTAYVNNYYQVAATSGQTVFSLPWSYDHTGEAIRVYVNGAHQPRTAYECTSSTSVTMGTGVTAGQIVEFESITSAVVDTIFANVAVYEASTQTYAGVASVSAASALASAVSASASAASALADAATASASAATATAQAEIAVEAADTALLQAPAWNGSTTYDYPQIVAATDGQTYRAIGPTTGDDPITDGGVHWAIVGVGIPSQAGNNGKFLSTDGANISWQYAPTSIYTYETAGGF